MARYFGNFNLAALSTVALSICIVVYGCSDPDQNGLDVGIDFDVEDRDVRYDVGDTEEVGPEPECELEFDDNGVARVFAFGSKIGVDDALSYETYEAYFRGQVEEIEPCLSEDRPNLLLFPEDVGLHAGLIGSRGEQARGAAGPDEAFFALFLDYDDTIGWVDDRYDDLELPRRIFLGLTDTLWRAVDSTFSGIAADYGVWVLTSANMANVEERSDSETVELWADPDLEDVQSVFVPVDENVYNSAIIYDPTGEFVTRVDKPFLTETEEEALALSYGSIEDVRPVEVGPLRFGVFTSKDAWMPPMNDRLGLLGSEVQVQPEAFSGWTTKQIDEQEEWLPDVLTQSGWSAVQKYSSFRYGAMPVLTGNFVGMTFDGQAVIWGQAHPAVEMGGFVGQYERPGFLEVGPWAFDDPGDDDPDLSLEERRQQLRELGEAMLPGAGEPHENAYVDSVVAGDLSGELIYEEGLEVGRFEEVEITNLSLGGDLALPDGPAQRVRIAADGDLLAAVWQEQRSGQLQIRRSLWEWNDDLGEYEHLTGTLGTTSGELIAPAVVLDGEGRALSVNQVVDAQASATDSTIRGVAFPGDEHLVDNLEIARLEDTRDVWLPALASDGDRIALVYTDRASGHDRVYLSISQDGGEHFEEPVAVDLLPDVGPPNTRGIQWHPDVAIRGDTIVVVWTDFRNFQWDLYGTFSLDGGDTWAEVRRIDDGGDDFERLHTDPRVILVDETNAIVSWTYQADRRPDTDARHRSWDLAEDEMEDSLALDSPGQTYPTHAWLPAVAPIGDDLAAAWLELRGDTPYVMIELPGFSDPQVISHPGRAAWWPDMAAVDNRVVVAWVEHEPLVGFQVMLGVLELE